MSRPRPKPRRSPTRCAKAGQGLATNADIAELRMATKADLAEVRGDIAKPQTDLAWVKWIVTGGVGLYALRSTAEWIR